MSPRILSVIFFAAALAFGSPASARTWKTVADYVLKNGAENAIKAPSSRLLGFDSDAVPARSMRIKSTASKDKKEHAVHIAYTKDDNGALTPNDVVLTSTLVSEKAGVKSVEGYKIRAAFDGRIISVMRAAGVVGEVEQSSVPIDSKDALALYKSESKVYLKDNKLEQLTK
jgi:hypothetical protein